MTASEVGLVVIGAVVTGALTGIGGAFGAAGAVRRELEAWRDEAKQELHDVKDEAKQELQDVKDEHGTRLTRVETRVGITKDGALTGNGLISRVHDLEAQGG